MGFAAVYHDLSAVFSSVPISWVLLSQQVNDFFNVNVC